MMRDTSHDWADLPMHERNVYLAARRHPHRTLVEIAADVQRTTRTVREILGKLVTAGYLVSATTYAAPERAA